MPSELKERTKTQITVYPALKSENGTSLANHLNFEETSKSIPPSEPKRRP